MSTKSRENRRAPLALSALPPLHLDLPEDGRPWLVCPFCRHWVEVCGLLVQTHHPDGKRCTGSGQPIDFDLTSARHERRRAAARAAERAAAEQPAAPRANPRRPAEPTAPRTRAWLARQDAPRRTQGGRRTEMAAALERAWTQQIVRDPRAVSAARAAAARA